MKNNLKIKIKNKSYQFKTYNKSNLKGLTWLPCKREWDPNINLHRLMRKKMIFCFYQKLVYGLVFFGTGLFLAIGTTFVFVVPWDTTWNWELFLSITDSMLSSQHCMCSFGPIRTRNILCARLSPLQIEYSCREARPGRVRKADGSRFMSNPTGHFFQKFQMLSLN